MVACTRLENMDGEERSTRYGAELPTAPGGGRPGPNRGAGTEPFHSPVSLSEKELPVNRIEDEDNDLFPIR